MSPQRAFPTTPVVKLGDHFSKVRLICLALFNIDSKSNYRLISQIKDFFKRFKKIPDIIELDHLTVSGDVTFGKGVSLRVR